jgi:flagellar assembly factor FliW
MSQLTLVGAEPEELIVHSDLLGDIALRSSDTFTFPQGILGFPECRKFGIVRGGNDRLYWMQSLEYSALVFLLVDPFAVFDNYAVDVPPAHLSQLGAVNAGDIALLAFVTLPGQTGELPTVNLQGPLAINFRTRLAKQIVFAEAEYGVRMPVDLNTVIA